MLVHVNPPPWNCWPSLCLERDKVNIIRKLACKGSQHGCLFLGGNVQFSLWLTALTGESAFPYLCMWIWQSTFFPEVSSLHGQRMTSYITKLDSVDRHLCCSLLQMLRGESYDKSIFSSESSRTPGVYSSRSSSSVQALCAGAPRCSAAVRRKQLCHSAPPGPRHTMVAKATNCFCVKTHKGFISTRVDNC